MYNGYMEYVNYDEFKKMDIRVGTIKEVEPVPETDKLLKFQIDFGTKEIVKVSEDGVEEKSTERDIRQIVSGIHEFYPDFEKLIGKQVLYIVNLEPREIKGVQSNGMLMAVDGTDGKPVSLMPEVPVNAGSRVR